MTASRSTWPQFREMAAGARNWDWQFGTKFARIVEWQGEPHRITSKKLWQMASQIVMDHTGDTRHHFDAADTEALSEAEERFRSLTKIGFTAAVRTPSGDIAQAKTFDPTAEETLFYPRLVGG
jgi:hypothetical protein